MSAVGPSWTSGHVRFSAACGAERASVGDYEWSLVSTPPSLFRTVGALFLKSVPQGAATSVFAATEDWAGGAVDTALRGRVRRAGRELAEAMVRRDATEVADPFALTTTFDELLAGG